MRRTGSRNVQIRFTAGRLTHFGGVYLIHRFLQQLQLRTFLSMRLRIPERNNFFSVTERLAALLYPMILGLNTIECSALLGTNGVFQYLTGIPRFPNPTTIRRFLMRTSSVLLPKLRSAHNELRSRFLLLPTVRSSVWLDFDSTAKTLYGNQEGAVKGYNPGHPGRKSYHPLVCAEAHLKDVLGGGLRHGNAHTADGVDEMFEAVTALLPHTTRLRVRADAGFFNGDFVKGISQKAGFAVVAPVYQSMKFRLPGLRYQRVNKTESTAEFHHQPYKWDRPYRFVVLREKLSEKRREQLTLFTSKAYAYHMIVTNLDLTPYGVFTFYQDRTGLERIIRILKDDLPFGKAPTKQFDPNALYAELSLLSYNLMIWFRRLCLPEDWQTYSVEILRRRLFSVPGEFTRTGNRPMLKLPKNSPYQSEFLSALERIKKLSSLV